MKRRVTLGADKVYDTREFVEDCRVLDVTPGAERHQPALGDRWQDHLASGLWVSIRVSKRIEEIFGWLTTDGGVRKTRYRGVERVALHLLLAMLQTIR